MRDDPYISGFIGYDPPQIRSLSPYKVSFIVDGHLQFMPTLTLVRRWVEAEGEDGD